MYKKYTTKPGGSVLITEAYVFSVVGQIQNLFPVIN